MSDPNEQSETTQRGAGADRDDTESRVEATPAAERRAQERDIDLTKVEGTGAGGRIITSDVERTYRQNDTAAARSRRIPPRQQPCNQTLEPCTPCTPPSEAEILEQYVVLKAALGSPIEGAIDLSKQEIAAVKQVDNTTVVVDRYTVIELVNGNIRRVNFPDNPCNFFAPMPPSAPVKWRFPRPQPLLPRCITGTCQRCRRQQCDLNIDIGVAM